MQREKGRGTSFGHLNLAQNLTKTICHDLLVDVCYLAVTKEVKGLDLEEYENLTCDEFLLYCQDYHDTSLSQLEDCSSEFWSPILIPAYLSSSKVTC